MAAFPEPTQDSIQMFLEFTGSGLDRAQIVRRIKAKNNNVEEAVNEWFTNPNEDKYSRDPEPINSWNDNLFNQDRDGNTNTAGISFNIQGSDVLPTNYHQSDGAPSRPPSRTSNNRSPLSKLIDLTDVAENAHPSQSMGFPEHEDRDMAQAIAASRADAGLPAQETGITNTDQVYFGPANRHAYEEGKWEMVPMSKSFAQEILLDPEPADRKRELDAPAFLKPSSADHRLGALLTIYHTIPLLREIFLDRIDANQNYGYDPEWWTGKAIQMPQVIEAGSDMDLADLEFKKEIQRLMAFLDDTERSYGSADALANMKAVTDTLSQMDYKSRNVESAVLETYKRIFQNNKGINKYFFSRGVDGPERNNSQDFAILDLSLPAKDSPEETIYDMADEVLWGSAPLDLSRSPFLTHIADVIGFRFTDWDESKKKSVEVPIVWYPDRYLEPARQAALDMRIQKQNVNDEVQRMRDIEQALTNYQFKGKTFKVADLFKTSLQHEVDEVENVAGLEHYTAEVATKRSSRTKNLSSQLQNLVEQIDRKLLALNEQKEKARESLRELSELYTKPSTDKTQPPLHRYTLRGVSTTKGTLYLCRQADPVLIDMVLDDGQTGPKPDQWWRIHYATLGSNPVTVEKTTEEKVLEAVKDEGTNSLLVYASDAAMSRPPQGLPKSLQTFVHKDNVLFRNELPQTNSASSSPKRKAESSNESEKSAKSPRWDQEGSVNVVEREVIDLDGPRAASRSLAQSINGNESQEMAMSFNSSLPDEPSQGQEMQERSNLRMLSSRAAEKPTTIDNMDLDQVMEDDHVAKESTAVKHVGFAD